MFRQDASKDQDPDLPTENEYLIIGGVHVVPLRQKVINLGRQQDNTVVIDDPRVSRHHAQLHAVHGRLRPRLDRWDLYQRSSRPAVRGLSGGYHLPGWSRAALYPGPACCGRGTQGR